MNWRTYRFFLKFLALMMGGSFVFAGAALFLADPFNEKAVRLRGDPFYDAIVDLVSIFGKTGTAVGLIIAGLIIGAVFYRAARR